MEPTYNSCLIVTRHELLALQDTDIKQICKQITTISEFPQNPQEQKQLLSKYDVVIGTLPVNLIQAIQQNGKTYITFSMKSLGTFKTAEEVKGVVEKYGKDRIAILVPSKPGELYRAMLYQGLKEVKVVVQETPIIIHGE